MNQLGSPVLIKKINSLIVSSNEETGKSEIASLLKLNKHKLGLILNERVLNFPFSVVPDLYSQLMEDVKFIETTDQLTVEDKKEWDFKYLIYFCYFNPKVSISLTLEPT